MSKDSKSKMDNKAIAIGLILIAVISAAGIAWANSSDDDDMSVKTETHEHSEGDGHDHDHSETYEYASRDSVPGVEILSVEEGDSGEWIMKVEFENIDIREDKVGEENVPGEGHAHVYVNGEKVSRFFSEDYTFVDPLQEGDVIKVDLNTNDHMTYTHDGIALGSVYTIGIAPAPVD